MGKFLVLIKNWIRGFRGNESSGGAGAPAANSLKEHEIRKIENRIDDVVFQNFGSMLHLRHFKNDVKYWQSVFKSLAYAESGFDLFCRYVEPPELGRDAVTGIQNTSEGLLQLSYQDSKYHACNFSWNEDKGKDVLDRSKTIFDLENNIKCGLAIMDKLLGKNGHYIFNKGNYWAVLKPSNKRHKVFLNKFNQYQKGEA